MNAKQVLNRIITLLSKEEEEKMATARLADGTIVESPAFAVGEAVEVVTEEGKIPAPDGEHELLVADAEGNEVLVKVKTEGGIITEREEEAVGEVEAEEEKPEEKEMMAEETEEVEPLPQDEDMMTKLSYRIEELEKKVAKFEEALPKMDEEVVDKDAEIEELEAELPKLNGAPVEQRMSKVGNAKGIKNSQSAFLSKLYR
jgi:uncharacterized coiled-coil protein SlyX